MKETKTQNTILRLLHPLFYLFQYYTVGPIYSIKAEPVGNRNASIGCMDATRRIQVHGSSAPVRRTFEIPINEHSRVIKEQTVQHQPTTSVNGGREKSGSNDTT